MPESKQAKPPPISVTRNPDGTFQFKGRSLNIVRDKNQALDPFGYELKCYGVKLIGLFPHQRKQNRQGLALKGRTRHRRVL